MRLSFIPPGVHGRQVFASPSDPLVDPYQQALQALASRPDDEIALSVSLPFCAVRCLCCDRHVSAAQSDGVVDDYVAGLVQEVQSLADHIGTRRDVLQVHLGGGSANELSESQLARLVHALRRHWRLPADAEMSVECDPRRSGWMQLRLLRGLGFRQVIFGVLDLDPTVQRAIGRWHSAALIDDVCQVARSCDIGCVSLDLMIGLPHQTLARWQNTLAQLVEIAPDRLRLARYRHRPWHAAGQHAIDADALPDAEQCQALVMLTADVLGAAGYRCVGTDLFVLETDELVQAAEEGRVRRSLIAYTTTPAVPLLGLGAGAASEIAGALFCNEASLPVWREAVRAGRLPASLAQPAKGWSS